MQIPMEHGEPGDVAVPRVDLYWYEVPPGEEEVPPAKKQGVIWGQLIGSVHRLYEVRDELQSATRLRDVRARLRRVALAVENYLYRAFEVRDRSIQLLAFVTGDTEGVKQVRHRRQRATAFRRLGSKAPILVGRTQRLFELLDSDVMLRNEHTHEQFLALGLFTGDDIYDPHDALTDVEHDPQALSALVNVLNTGIRCLRREYLVRIRQIADAALEVAEASDPRYALKP